MPAIPSALSALIQTKVDANMAAVSGTHPLAQKTPMYFIEMCTAIGTGIASGSPSISFTTADTGFTGAPPVPGAGTGVGIVVDSSAFTQDLYNRVRGYIIADFGKTSHQPYPPAADNSGQYLLALCKGISDAVMQHYTSAWTLTSAHPLIYAGTGAINDGHFSGLVAPTIKSLIVSNAPDFHGPFWPRLAQAISESYVDAIHNHSTGTVTIVGICVPTPIPLQLCNIPSVGTGSGVAT